MRKRILACILTVTLLMSGHTTAFSQVIADTQSVSENTLMNEETVETGETEQEQNEGLTGSDVAEEDADEISVEKDISSETEAEESEQTDISAEMETGEVSRINWLKELIAVYGFTAAEEDYPDNYFPDITSDSPYYQTVMVATEYGLIDTMAGTNFEPDAAATREFAAHTLNLYMGAIAESESYTFNEAETVTYPDDIQAIVDLGLLSLSDGAFLPTKSITEAEKTAMLAEAEKCLALSSAYGETDTYEFRDTVKVLPNNTEILTDEDGNLTITDCPVQINEGDLFGIVYDGMPLAWKAKSVTTTGQQTKIVVETADLEEAFVQLDMANTAEVPLEDVEALNPEAQISYIVGGTEEKEFEDGKVCDSLESVGNQEVNAVLVTEELTPETGLNCEAKKDEVSIGWDKEPISVTLKITDIKVDYAASIKKKQAKIGVNFDAKLICSASTDILDALGIEPKIPIVAVQPIPGVNMGIDLYAKFSGEVTATWSGHVNFVVEFKNNRFYRRGDIIKKDFCIEAMLDMSTGVRATASVNVLVFSGSVYVDFGVRETVSRAKYDTGLPTSCFDVEAYTYGKMGYSLSVGFSYFKMTKEEEYDFLSKYTSNIRVSYHKEDGKIVKDCTRPNDFERASDGAKLGYCGAGYFSPIGSSYYFDGSHSKGTNAAGQEYTIFEYSLDDKNKATITKYNGTARTIFIPRKLDGYEVVGIGRQAFSGNDYIRSVIMGDNITEIKDYAFSNCSALESVELSKKLVRMEGCAFKNCDKLTEIEIPKSLKESTVAINSEGPFSECDNLTEVRFEAETTRVSPWLFANCTGLKEIVIPDTVTEINYGAFRDCVNLENVTIGKKVTTIKSSAFGNCNKIQKIQMPDSVTTIKEFAFLNCIALESVELSKKLVRMEGCAFKNCDKLTEIEIPKSLKESTTTINSEGPFSECDNLTEVRFEEGTTRVSPYLFGNCIGLKEIVIPDTVTEINNKAFSDCVNLENVTIGKCVTTIGSYAFENCKIIQNILIPDSVTLIKRGAFYDCISLQEIVISDSVTTIEEYAFSDCIALESVELSKKLIRMEGCAFKNCDKLTEIEIPKSLKESTTAINSEGPFSECDNLTEVRFEAETTRVSPWLFANCTGLKEIVIPDTVTEINYGAFRECVNLENVTIGKKVATIGITAFQNCKNLKRIDIPSSVKTIDDNAFQNCISMTEAIINDSVEKMGDYLFYGCVSLEKVQIPNTRKIITQSMFSNCSALKEINLPQTLTTIEKEAFYNCDALTELKIPDQVTVIKENAFYNCDGLKKLELSDTLTQVGKTAFYDCNALESVSVPNSVTSLGVSAFQSCDKLKEITLGTGLTEIPTYAFADNGALTSIIIPYQVTKINDYAFKNDTSLTEVTIPKSVTTIGKEAFSYPPDMKIYGVSGSYANTYADDNDIAFVAREVPAQTVTLSKTSMEINKGAEKQLFLTVTPANFTDDVTWKSTNTKIVTVDAKGVVRAVAQGTASIKVYVGNIPAICSVTVNQPVTFVSLGKKSAEMEAGQSLQLTATVSPSNANNKAISFSSSDESVATVSQTGLVTALKKGSTEIRAEAVDGSGKYATCKITVNSELKQAETVERLESNHPYENGSADSWVYTLPGASSLSVTFNAQTEVEDGCDYICIYNKGGEQVGKYTGKELAGKTISVPGDTVRVQVKADSVGNAWGFKVDTVKEGTGSGQNPATPSIGGNSGSGSTPSSGDTTENPSNDTDIKKDAYGNLFNMSYGTPELVNTMLCDKNLKYRVTSIQEGNIQVSVIKAKKSSVKNVSIPSEVTFNGVSYKVTEISSNAFKNNKKLQKVIIGKNTKKIGANAFSGCKKLKSIVIKSSLLTKASVKKNAFKNTHKSLKIKVPKKKLRAYGLFFKTKGNKKVKITK